MKNETYNIVTIQCPSCWQTAVISENGVHAICENVVCPAKRLIKMQHIFEIFDLEYISDSTIESLYNSGFTTLGMIFSLTEEKIAKLDGFGKRKAANIVSKLKTIKITEAQALKCAMVKGISESNGQKLIDYFGSIDNFLQKAYTTDIDKIDGFGDIMANTIYENIDVFKDIYQELMQCSVVIMQEQKPEATKENLVFTGKCSQYGRKELTKVLEEQGYNIQSGINKDTDILLVEDSNSGSSKIKKAEKFGTRIISYDEFFERT